jgi:hypothetical protein
MGKIRLAKTNYIDPHWGVATFHIESPDEASIFNIRIFNVSIFNISIFNVNIFNISIYLKYDLLSIYNINSLVIEWHMNRHYSNNTYLSLLSKDLDSFKMIPTIGTDGEIIGI